MTETIPLPPKKQLLLHYDDKYRCKPMSAVKLLVPECCVMVCLLRMSHVELCYSFVIYQLAFKT